MVKHNRRSIQWLACATLLTVIVQNANAGVVINDSYVVGDVWQSFPPYDEAYLEVNPLLNSSGSFAAAVGDVSLKMNHSLTQVGGIFAFDVECRPSRRAPGRASTGFGVASTYPLGVALVDRANDVAPLAGVSIHCT